jgi:hypothetical protein
VGRVLTVDLGGLLEDLLALVHRPLAAANVAGEVGAVLHLVHQHAGVECAIG